MNMTGHHQLIAPFVSFYILVQLQRLVVVKMGTGLSYYVQLEFVTVGDKYVNVFEDIYD